MGSSPIGCDKRRGLTFGSFVFFISAYLMRGEEEERQKEGLVAVGEGRGGSMKEEYSRGKRRKRTRRRRQLQEGWAVVSHPHRPQSPLIAPHLSTRKFLQKWRA